MAAGTRCVPLIVATTEHWIDPERLALRAGTNCCAPGAAPELLDPSLRATMASTEEKEVEIVEIREGRK